MSQILGSGVDIVETGRIRDSIARFGDRFLHRCFLPGEIAYCQPLPFAERHFAARFAAKEAIAKAFGTGIGAELGWRDMEVCRHPSGAPYVKWHGGGLALARHRQVAGLFLSLSHCEEYAVAQAILVGASA